MGLGTGIFFTLYVEHSVVVVELRKEFERGVGVRPSIKGIFHTAPTASPLKAAGRSDSFSCPSRSASVRLKSSLGNSLPVGIFFRSCQVSSGFIRGVSAGKNSKCSWLTIVL